MGKRKTIHPRRKPKASTQEVVGEALNEPEISRKWRKYYRRLIELRDHLLQERFQLAQGALEEELKFGTHMADAGTDSYDRDFALGVLSAEQDAVYEIEEALQRIRSGNFGVCELTGRRIEAARLEAIPWTRFSAEAERQLEREGLQRRARLGPREAVARAEIRDEEESA
jgi:RNA polymerase-binding transcription factor DksA